MDISSGRTIEIDIQFRHGNIKLKVHCSRKTNANGDHNFFVWLYVIMITVCVNGYVFSKNKIVTLWTQAPKMYRLLIINF